RSSNQPGPGRGGGTGAYGSWPFSSRRRGVPQLPANNPRPPPPAAPHSSPPPPCRPPRPRSPPPPPPCSPRPTPAPPSPPRPPSPPTLFPIFYFLTLAHPPPRAYPTMITQLANFHCSSRETGMSKVRTFFLVAAAAFVPLGALRAQAPAKRPLAHDVYAIWDTI